MPTSSVEGQERSGAVLEVDSLAAGYGKGPVISEVSLNLRRGEIVALVGPNGAGKSTLLKAIIGMIPVMSGKVRLEGSDVTNLRSELLIRKGVGYVPQRRDVFDNLTVAENLQMGGYLLSKSELQERLEEVLSLFPAVEGMQDRIGQKLSGGERKMVALARVMMLRPSILALDEPTANLSAALSEMVLKEFIPALAKQGRTSILLVEQKALLAMEVADSAHILVAGKTKVVGPAHELLAREDIRQVFLGGGKVEI